MREAEVWVFTALTGCWPGNVRWVDRGYAGLMTLAKAFLQRQTSSPPSIVHQLLKSFDIGWPPKLAMGRTCNIGKNQASQFLRSCSATDMYTFLRCMHFTILQQAKF